MTTEFKTFPITSQPQKVEHHLSVMEYQRPSVLSPYAKSVLGVTENVRTLATFDFVSKLKIAPNSEYLGAHMDRGVKPVNFNADAKPPTAHLKELGQAVWNRMGSAAEALSLKKLFEGPKPVDTSTTKQPSAPAPATPPPGSAIGQTVSVAAASKSTNPNSPDFLAAGAEYLLGLPKAGFDLVLGLPAAAHTFLTNDASKLFNTYLVNPLAGFYDVATKGSFLTASAPKKEEARAPVQVQSDAITLANGAGVFRADGKGGKNDDGSFDLH